jgi:integrase
MESRGLTDLKIRNVKPAAKRVEIPDGGQRGLYLIVQPSGKRSFALRYRLNGKPCKLTLAPGLSLADARRRAAEIMYQVEIGSDPGEQKRAEQAKPEHTLQAIAERYLKREGGKLRTADTRARALQRLVFPVLGGRQIDSIKRTEVSDLLDKIEDQNGSRAADLVLAYLRKIFNWYAIQSDSFMSPVVPGMGRYSISENRRKRFLNDDEIRTLWQATEVDGPFAALLRFLLLTGCRRSEGAGLRWDEIDGHNWLLPASRHKNKHIDLLRPLSNAALAVVQAQPMIVGSPFVFSYGGERPVSFGGGPRRFLQTIKIDKNWRLHDLRRTARTLLSRAKVDSDIAEKCLGHMPSGLRQTYDQHRFQAELRHAFEALAAQIDRIVNPPPAVVTPLRR